MRGLLVAVLLVVVLMHGEDPIATVRAPEPTWFEINAGQWDARVRFRARRDGTTLWLTDEGMTLDSAGAPVTISIVGARPAIWTGEIPLPARSNFFRGRDRWRAETYARVRAHRALSGVDVVWHGGIEGLEWDLEVAAGVDAHTLAFAIDGAESIAVAESGALEIRTRTGAFVQKPPRVVQLGRELRAKYVILDDHRVRFAIDRYDPLSAVLVDPVVGWSTYLGGSDLDNGARVAVDGSGNTYVAGNTLSTDFPTKQALQSSYGTGGDAFVTKLDASGSVVYSTYFGGTGGDYATGIAVDGNGAAYVAGYTWSTDFPTKNAYQSTFAGGIDAFVTKIDPSGGSLAYSTYFGGSLADSGDSLAIDTNGNAYLFGDTVSTDLPTKNAYQSSFGGYKDAFVAKLGGSSLAYSTYLGGASSEYPADIAVDTNGNAFVIGGTYSDNFPTTNGAFQTSHASSAPDAFVTKLDASGSVSYSTYFGGTSTEAGTAIAVDANGNAYIAGHTDSKNLPTKNAFQSAYAGGMYYDAYVAKLDAMGSTLVYATYLGGSSDDRASGVAVDTNANAYVVGWTFSTNFPSKKTLQAAAPIDAFVTKLSPNGSTLIYSTFFGGSANDTGYGIAVDSNGVAHFVGSTASQNFPVKNAVQSSYGGGSIDAFAATIVSSDFANGTACNVDDECSTGYCRDGFCCDSDCTDACAACDVQGKVGTCSAVAGVPHGSRTPCGGEGACAGTCDGVNASSCAFPGTSTACDSTCANGAETDRVCDGKGTCIAGATRPCESHACDGKKCKPIVPSPSDAGSEAGCIDCTPPPSQGGCSCSASADDRREAPLFLALVLLLWKRRARPGTGATGTSHTADS